MTSLVTRHCNPPYTAPVRGLVRAAAALGIAAGLASAAACRIDNPDHCFNRSSDSHAWCANTYADDRPLCSPCAAEFNGCVEAEPTPDECPRYVAPDEDTDADADSDTDTDEDTNTDADADADSDSDIGIDPTGAQRDD